MSLEWVVIHPHRCSSSLTVCFLTKFYTKIIFKTSDFFASFSLLWCFPYQPSHFFVLLQHEKNCNLVHLVFSKSKRKYQKWNPAIIVIIAVEWDYVWMELQPLMGPLWNSYITQYFKMLTLLAKTDQIERKKKYLFSGIRCFGWVVNTSALYSEDTGPRPTNHLPRLRFFMIFLSPSRQMMIKYLKVGHGHFLLFAF